jgi:hypothetical protein
LLATGVLGLLTWVGIDLVDMSQRVGEFDKLFWPLFTFGPLVCGLAGVQIVGALLMLRLRCYPWAATAAILAHVPWSPAWLLGLPFGIWACNVLGKPEVTEVFFGDRRRTGSGPADARPELTGVAGRFLSLFRSVGRYILPTMRGRTPATGDPPDASAA